MGSASMIACKSLALGVVGGPAIEHRETCDTLDAGEDYSPSSPIGRGGHGPPSSSSMIACKSLALGALAGNAVSCPDDVEEESSERGGGHGPPSSTSMVACKSLAVGALECKSTEELDHRATLE